MRPPPHTLYSWRDDPAVPSFDEGRILVVMDGACGLCSAAARRIALWDRRDQVRITTATSPLGRALLAHFGMDPEDPASWLMVQGGQARGSLEGMIALFPQFILLGHFLRPLGWLPFGVQDWIYARIARNRYRIWGKGDLCALPEPALRKRLVE